jgi:L-iditol 2-dehydrogenase
MKSVVLTGIRKMEVREAPTPQIENDTDVLLKVGCIGVCGSDIHYYTTGRIGCQVVKYPYRIGHEFAATVQATGKGVKRLKPGMRVAVEPAMSCGRCDQCRAHRRHTCRRLRFLGCPGQVEGCLSEYIVMPAECCYPIKRRTTMEQAAIAEPLSIGVYAVSQSVAMRGARIGILGAGPTGLSVLLAAISRKAGRIYVTDKIEARMAAALRAGADWAGNPLKQDVVAEIAEKEPLLLDAVFECCGEQDALDQALNLLKPGGKLMLLGIPEVDRVSFAIDTLRRREICIQNIRRQNECMQPALDLIEKGKVAIDFMVTHRFPLERTQEAFDLVAGYQDGVVKAVINVG